MPARLFVLDGPGYLFRAYHALPYLSTSRGVPVNTVLGMSTMLWKLLRDESPDYFAVAWDPPGPTFRDEKFAAYKETRAATPDDLKRQIPLVMQVIQALRIPVLEVPGFEADDVLGTVVDRARAHDLDVVLVTQDKDMLQLVGPRVTVLAPGARAGEQTVYDADKVREKWGVGPEQIPDLLALMGDSIDNIPGVPGVGQKTAVKLIGQFGSVDGLYQHLSLVPGKLRETLAANRKQALLSRELATVSTRVPLPDDLEALRRAEPDWERLRAVWTELELRNLLRQLPDAPGVSRRREEETPLAGAEELATFLAKVPEGEPLAVDWAEEGGPPDPVLTRVGLHHPAAGDIQVPQLISPLPRAGAAARQPPRRPPAHRPRRQAPLGVGPRARRRPAGDRGHRARRVSPQPRALELQDRGGRATSISARRRAGPAGRARAAGVVAVGAGGARAARGQGARAL